MGVLSEAEALAAAIGQYTLGVLGRERLRALQVLLDPKTFEAVVTIVLLDDTAEAELEALSEALGIEEVYADEAVLRFRFADSIPANVDAHAVYAMA